MKIVGVISSPHEEGNSATLLREALGAAEAAGAETEELFLPGYRIEFCRACGACLQEGSCPISDDFEQVKAALREADGIILSTPTYGAAPSARMKNLLDRLGQLAFLTSFFGGKYLAGIATAGSFGHRSTAAQLTSIARGSVFRRARVSGSLGVVLRGRRVQELPNALTRAKRLGSKIARDIRSRRAYPLQNLGSRIVNSLLMRPLLSRGIVQHRQKGFQAVYRELADGGLLRMRAEC
jgi:multimeric flavodoxin WrbA